VVSYDKHVNLDSYPGCFLKSDLEEKIEKSCNRLSEGYLAEGDRAGSEEALRNILIAKNDAVPKYDPFQRLCKLQKRWRELMLFTDNGYCSIL
jgi:hypothetical protein